VQVTWIELTLAFQLHTGYNILGKNTDLAEQVQCFRAAFVKVMQRSSITIHNKRVTFQHAFGASERISSLKQIHGFTDPGLMRRPSWNEATTEHIADNVIRAHEYAIDQSMRDEDHTTNRYIVSYNHQQQAKWKPNALGDLYEAIRLRKEARESAANDQKTAHRELAYPVTALTTTLKVSQRKGPCFFGHTTSSLRKNGKETWQVNPSPSFWENVDSGVTICQKCYGQGFRLRKRARGTASSRNDNNSDDITHSAATQTNNTHNNSSTEQHNSHNITSEQRKRIADNRAAALHRKAMRRDDNQKHIATENDVQPPSNDNHLNCNTQHATTTQPTPTTHNQHLKLHPITSEVSHAPKHISKHITTSNHAESTDHNRQSAQATGHGAPAIVLQGTVRKRRINANQKQVQVSKRQKLICEIGGDLQKSRFDSASRSRGTIDPYNDIIREHKQMSMYDAGDSATTPTAQSRDDRATATAVAAKKLQIKHHPPNLAPPPSLPPATPTFAYDDA
jgi:hypothetical protein